MLYSYRRLEIFGDMFLTDIYGILVRYFMETALLVIIHIICTQKWAGGFTEPPATTRICVFTTIEIYTKFQLKQKRTGD